MTMPVEFMRAISREAVNALPIKRYEGEVHLVASREDAERAAADFAAERVVGFDTETRPAFRAGVSYPPALVQVASSRAVYLFQLARVLARGEKLLLSGADLIPGESRSL